MGPKLPVDDREKLAKLLFAFENPPGTKDVAGSQDAIGIVYPGLNRMDYDNEYWPTKIVNTLDENVLNYLEDRLCLKFVQPRPGDFQVLHQHNPCLEGARNLAEAADRFWLAAHAMDGKAMGQAMIDSLGAQVSMFPLMRMPAIDEMIDQFKDDVLGYKISGAGGGGFVAFFSENEIPDAIRPKIRRADGVVKKAELCATSL